MGQAWIGTQVARLECRSPQVPRGVLTLANLEELHAAVLGVPGVVGAEVSGEGAATPSVRVWTDNSRDPEELQAEVRSLVLRARSGGLAKSTAPVIRDFEPPDEPLSKRQTTVPQPRAVAPIPGLPRRSGLGRGLDSLIPDAGAEPPPAHLVSIDLSKPPALEMIAIEESASGVTVRASDTARNVAEAKVIGGTSSINPAIVTAVAELLGELPAPHLVSVELRDTEVAAVLVLTLEMADATLAAGAAIVQGGMPFTLGKAAWSAIRSVRD